ncbi:MAG: DUF3035 domain-containing protein [Rhodospirillales bacterium]
MTLMRPALVLIACALATSACSNVREAVIPGKRSPDEFATYSRAPLSLPPEYDLTVPQPGAERPQSVTPSDLAQKATIGTATGGSELSTGENELLVRTGALNVDPEIRQLVNRETSILAEENETFVNNIIFWQNNTSAAEVDPTAEAKRIREKQALGDPITGEGVPTIEKKKKGLLEGVF